LSQEKQGCYTGIVIAGQGVEDNRLWVVDALQLKSQDAYVIIDNLIGLYLKYDPMAIVIEDCVWQRALASFFDGEAKKQHIYPRIETVGRSDHRSKDERIMGLSPYWRSNAIMMPVRAGATESLIQELHHFPKGRTRDLSDAFSRILDIKYGIQQKNIAKTIEKIEKEYRESWGRR
jgi:predicted phage terminase large subunit-like protein